LHFFNFNAFFWETFRESGKITSFGKLDTPEQQWIDSFFEYIIIWMKIHFFIIDYFIVIHCFRIFSIRKEKQKFARG